MALKDKLLNAVGLERMTNLDVLLEDLAALDAERFEYMVLSRQSDLPELIQGLMCEDCKAEHGGSCPMPEDDGCAISLAEWFARPCARERILPEVTA